ncbi:hypothetical protein FHS67_001385 [Aminobacter aminovorans]|jgi:hypothetical protein|uniref:Uncharacterized protein n=2 Tax=Aminobacter aminovorans TaxID=83263 RepID=A0ABR6H3K3_AMIAI|nr:hypothetical protein [Aminobacter aminovorans]
MLKSLICQGAGISILTPIDISRAAGRRAAFRANCRMFELLSISARDVKALSPSADMTARIMAASLDAALDAVGLGAGAQ